MSFALLKYFKKRAPIFGKVATAAFSALMLSNLPTEKKEKAAEVVTDVTDAVGKIAVAIKTIKGVDLDEDDLAEVAAEVSKIVARYALLAVIKKTL